LKLSTSQIFMD